MSDGVYLVKLTEKYLVGVAAAVTAILSWLLLALFPFYPAQLTVILAVALGLVGVKSARTGLMLATLLSMLGALYQGELVGLTFFIVLVIASSLDSWDLALTIASWLLAFLTPVPSLAIIPAVLNGLRHRPGDALRLSVLSGVTIFLLCWVRGISHAGLMLVPSTSFYAAKSIPSPWQFTLFLPNVDILTMSSLTNYYAPLLANLNDYRLYVVLIAWSTAGYVTALLALTGKKSPAYFVSGLVGVLPAAIAGLILIKTPPLEVAAVLIVGAVLPLGYLPVRSRADAVSKDRNKSTVSAPPIPAPRDGRRLAAIMITDVARYSVLAKEDDPNARALLETEEKLSRQIVEKHDGQEIKTIGDISIVEFTDALSAVNCAVELQDVLEKEKLMTNSGKEMKVRIGIHLGDVIHREGDVVGEAVNIASRIEILSDPGGVCISRQVYDQVWSEANYDFTALTPHELKNVQYPTEIYRVSRTKGNQQS